MVVLILMLKALDNKGFATAGRHHLQQTATELLATQGTQSDNAMRAKVARSPQRKLQKMTQPKRFQDRNADELPAELVELGELLGQVDCEHSEELVACFNRVSESVLRRRRILGLVQEALSQLRLDVKYLMFDLEMTRRERDELQSRIEGDGF